MTAFGTWFTSARRAMLLTAGEPGRGAVMWRCAVIRSDHLQANTMLVEAFRNAFLRHGSPELAALFCSTRMTCECTYYFSPVAVRTFAVELENRICMKPCAAPDAESVRFVDGDIKVKTLLAIV